MISSNPLFKQFLIARGLTDEQARTIFLSPDYAAAKHDPFLLPGMKEAVERLAIAKKKQESVAIYGDYDVDGLTATSILLDAFRSFGILTTSILPNRFTEGYGMNANAVKRLSEQGIKLIVTVDCGSLSHDEITLAKNLGMEVIVTDHHTVGDTLPPDALAVINPKRHDNTYPFNDLAGCGVAFKLVQALQTRLPGLPDGQEKWLLDLVALGTVCDVVSLKDENRMMVHWGLKVMQKTRRPGLKAMLAVAGVEPENITARTLGFMLGPRLNAAGRLETAQLGLDLLSSTDNMHALSLAQKLDDMNKRRRTEQDKIFKEACEQAEQYADDPVLVLSSQDWSHGIVGIVAAKILERYKKPTFVLEEMGEDSKGSARSYGDFSAVEAVRNAKDHIIKGGGHALAAGVTLKTAKMADFRKSLNDFYRQNIKTPQSSYLDPKEDVGTDELFYLTEELVRALSSCEPFGHGNPEPVFAINDMVVTNVRHMGTDNQHIKVRLSDKNGLEIANISFGNAHEYQLEPGDKVRAWICLNVNEWNGSRSVEGRLLKLERLN